VLWLLRMRNLIVFECVQRTKGDGGHMQVRKRKLKIVRLKKDIELGLFISLYSKHFVWNNVVSYKYVSSYTARTYRNTFRASTSFCPVLIKILVCKGNLVQLPNIKFWGYS